MTQRNVPETPAPMRAPQELSWGIRVLTAAAATATPTAKANTTVEWPNEKKNPHGIVHGRDMVRIEGVPQSEHIGDETQANELWVAHGIM
jgi:hypothetical protein